MHKNFLFSMLMLSMLAPSLGCGKSRTITTPDGGEVTVDKTGDEVEVAVTGPEGEKMTLKGSESGIPLPANFPKDVPIPSKAKPVSNATMGQVTTVALESTKPLAEIVTFYEVGLKKNGWKIEGSGNTPMGSFMGATKQKRSLNVMISKRDEVSVITLIMGQQ
ncbi:MAG: hypothetical protein JW888_09065 [Pirellulales bacterium]|nr:hypothetical protein [Pirellulales bacterium]